MMGASEIPISSSSALSPLQVLEGWKRRLLLLAVARRRCERQAKHLRQMHPKFPGCAPHFDGLLCWGPEDAGAVQSLPCPSPEALHFDPSTASTSAPSTAAAPAHAQVNRTCHDDGSWEERAPGAYVPCGLSDAQVHEFESRVSEVVLEAEEAAAAEAAAGAGPVTGADLAFLRRRLEECEARRIASPPPLATKDETHFCPITFDGWTCWDYTPAGDTAYSPCPDFLVGFDPHRFAFRECLENGTWFRHPQSNLSWSNYTTCVDVDDFQFRQLVNRLYVGGYTVSFVALVISLLIFFCFRSLKCTRIAVHVQLFLSFAANNLGWILWYRLVVEDVAVLTQNALWCRGMHVLLQYLMVANYMWMFCEGLHLHLALVVVFVKDELVMRWFYAVGWGLPAAVAALYAAWRSSRSPNDTRRCWTDNSVCEWALTAPVLLSLGASAVFLCNVLRVLLTKLHSRSANPAPIGLRKAARAALILVPLFGLHHALLPFRPEPGSRFEGVYQIFSAILISLQGLCVSCLFCFANVDVHCAMRPLLRRVLPGRRLFRSAHANNNALCDSGSLRQPPHTQHSTQRDACV